MKRSQITHLSASKRRADSARHMIGAGGIDQQRFGDGIPAAGRAIDQQAADLLGAGRTARFACRDDGDALGCKRGGQALGLGGFARALAAFERDEPPGSCLPLNSCAEHAATCARNTGARHRLGGIDRHCHGREIRRGDGQGANPLALRDGRGQAGIGLEAVFNPSWESTCMVTASGFGGRHRHAGLRALQHRHLADHLVGGLNSG